MKLLSLGEVEVVAMVFSRVRGITDDHLLVCTAEPMDWSDRVIRFGQAFKQADPIEFDGFGKRWYCVGVADCFDPPLVVVRADNESDAQEAFLSEKPWADWDQDTIDASTADDGEEATFNHLTYTDRGTWAETEGIVIYEVYPLRAEFA